MCLLRKAEEAWEKLLNFRYDMVFGRKKKSYVVSLSFERYDFPHLVGMQYANDVDFKINSAEYYGEKLITAILSGRLDPKRIEKSKNWDRIQKRLQVLVNLQDTLENGFSFFLFSKAKVPRYSKIDAEYLIRNNHSGEMFFVFLDKESGRYFCKSAFGSEMDYSRNQTPLTLLYKCRVEGENKEVLFQHPKYVADTI